MSKREETLERFIIDAFGFIRWCMDNDKSSSLIGSTLVHDISGLVNDDETFSPRVTGYAKHAFTGTK